jgi:hypothetical protein
MAALTVLAVLVSTFALASPAQAVESISELQWPAVNAQIMQFNQIATSPKGDVTIGCYWLPTTQDLTTYSATGAVTRKLDQTQQIDGKSNCITEPVVDKNGDAYGVRAPYSGNGGTNMLLAYTGNTLKWKYASGTQRPVVGINGNIYFTIGGSRLIGLAPNLASGQTAPTKVLDVSCICRGDITAFKEGLAFKAESNFTFYKYDGTSLGSFDTSSAYNYSTPNAVGRVFYATLVSGTTTSVKVSAYDPIAQRTTWTTQVSTPGADVSSLYNLTPLPGGGVVANINQQVMVSDSVPANPVDYDNTLVALASNGQPLWKKRLPMTGWYERDANNYKVSQINPVADTTGKFVLVQQWSDSRPPWTMYGRFITVDTFDATTGTSTAPTKKFSGNDDTASGPKTGYEYVAVDGIPVIGPNTVYLPAKQCIYNTGGCYETKMYPIKVAGLGLDYPRGITLTSPVPVPYVAMGDSYSAGEGVPPFEFGSNVSGGNQCHRSVVAYSRLVSQYTNLGASLAAGSFTACSGAKTEHIIGTKFNGEDPQVTKLNAGTKIVSLTIGGNDIGFTEFGTSCVKTTCAKGTTPYTTALNKINNELPTKLDNAYKKILDSSAKTAKIYVLGYPQPAPAMTTTSAFDPRCFYLFDGKTGTDNWGDARGARDIVTNLNAKISTRVAEVKKLKADYNNRLVYVDVNKSDSPFADHTACSGLGDSYFNNVDQVLNGIAYVFHPNDKGQAAYAKVLATAMGG